MANFFVDPAFKRALPVQWLRFLFIYNNLITKENFKRVTLRETSTRSPISVVTHKLYTMTNSQILVEIFLGLYGAVFRLGQEAHQILFKLQYIP